MTREKLKLTTSGNNIVLTKEVQSNLLKRSNEYVENTQITGVHHNDKNVIFNSDGDAPEYQGELLLGPQRLQEEGRLELQILEKTPALPAHMKMINRKLNVDDEGYVTLEKLEKTLIVKIAESDDTDEDTDDESSTDYSGSNTDIEEQSFSKYTFHLTEDDFPPICRSSDSKLFDAEFSDGEFSDSEFSDADEFNCTQEKSLFDNNINDFEDDDTDNDADIEEVIISEKSVTPRSLVISEDIQRELACYKKLAGDAESSMQIVITGKTYYTILPYIPGNILTDVIKNNIKLSTNNSPQFQLNAIRQAVRAVKLIHDHDIVHGDLKPDNLIMAENRKKMTVIDFGGSAIMGLHKEIIDYTHHYVPPEYYRLAKDQKDLPADIGIDFYALGVILLHCLLYAFDDAGMDERAMNRNRGLKPGGFYENTYHTELYPEIDEPEFFENWKLNRIDAEKTDIELKNEFDIMVKAFKDDMQKLSKKFEALGPDAGPLLKQLIDSLVNKDPNLRPTNCNDILAKLDLIEIKYNLSMYLQNKCPAKFFQPAELLNGDKKTLIDNSVVCRA